MSRSELRAQEIFKSYNLKDESEEVKRNLMILLLTIPKQRKSKKSWTARFAGAWQGGETTEELLETIRESRTTNREINL